VAAIFKELAGDRSQALEGPRQPAAVTTTITAALASDLADEIEVLHKDEIAFHLIDWRSDAAFLVALHLFPERFTREEIAAGIDLFLIHVPAHVIAAARLSGNSTDDVFAADDKDGQS
jgi:hypothetical protein